MYNENIKIWTNISGWPPNHPNHHPNRKGIEADPKLIEEIKKLNDELLQKRKEHIKLKEELLKWHTINTLKLHKAWYKYNEKYGWADKKSRALLHNLIKDAELKKFMINSKEDK